MAGEQDGALARFLASLAALGEIEGRARPSDSQLIQALGFYTGRSPQNVLRLAAWQAGDGDALGAYRKGRPLPARTRDILEEMLNGHLESEREADARCRDAAGGMAWLSLDFLALAAVLLLFIG